jgi:hypothetical protein
MAGPTRGPLPRWAPTLRIQADRRWAASQPRQSRRWEAAARPCHR